MHIPENEIHYSAYSLLDSFGRVFFWGNRVFRGINSNSLKLFDKLRDDGLISELEKNNLIPNTFVSNYTTDRFDVVLEHELIHPTTFVYEWGFDMIKGAGKCILKVNEISYKYGYETIDAHPYNILFKGCNPIFIDFGSFSKLNNTSPWKASEEYSSYFKYTLNIWNKVGHNMAKRIYSDDINVFTESEYKSLYGLKNSSFQFLKSIPNKIINRLKIKQGKAEYIGRSAELIKLGNELNRLKRNNITTVWGDYHGFYLNNNKVESTPRFNYIVDKIKELKIKNVTELAGNWGLLSYLIFEGTDVKKIICTDCDEEAINKMYNFFRQNAYLNQLSPVLLDFMKPIELYNSGRPSNRLKSEAVLALAITHHLLLTDNYKIEVILEKISKYTTKYAFIEFMPLGLWNGYTAPEIPQWYNQEWFTLNFLNYFTIIDMSKIEENRILYIGRKK